jgi:hypothetical protein
MQKHAYSAEPLSRLHNRRPWLVGCEAGKHVKCYFRKLSADLRFALTGPTPMGEDKQGTIMVAHHRHPSDRTQHMDLQLFATQE